MLHIAADIGGNSFGPLRDPCFVLHLDGWCSGAMADLLRERPNENAPEDEPEGVREPREIG